MKTVLAQGRKDLASNYLLLSVWGVCVGIDSLSFLSRISFHTTSMRGTGFPLLFASLLGATTAALAAYATQALLAIVLLIRIVQADCLTDSNAFWRTRPVARNALLAEKSLFALLFVAGGVVAGAAMQLNSRHPAGGTAIIGALAFVSGLMAFAAVTSDFSRCVVAFLALAWGAMIVAALSLALLRHLSLLMPPLLAGEYVAAFYLLAFAAIVALQYLTLRTNLARSLLFATFFLATVLQGM